MTWNFNMDEAPRGSYRDVVKTVGKNTKMTVVHVPDLIIAAGNGGVVTLSRWLPDQSRWNMFTKDAPPFAWMPWPTHPEAAA